MTPEQVERGVKLADSISRKLINNAITIVNEKFAHNYHRQNPKLLTEVIDLQKQAYISSIEEIKNNS